MESWWNGRFGSLAGERVYLRVNAGQWSVVHDGPGEAYTITPCGSEEQARAELARYTMTGAGWRRVDSRQR